MPCYFKTPIEDLSKHKVCYNHEHEYHFCKEETNKYEVTFGCWSIKNWDTKNEVRLKDIEETIELCDKHYPIISTYFLSIKLLGKAYA